MKNLLLTFSLLLFVTYGFADAGVGEVMRTIVIFLLMHLTSLVNENFTREIKQWEFDKSNSTLEFSVDRVILSPVHGHVKDFHAYLMNWEDDFTKSKIEMTAEVNSITTGNKNRDRELKGNNFFESQKFPAISFVSSRIEKKDADHYIVSGNLTMHGITREIKLDVKHKWLNNKTIAVFSINCSLNRSDFSIGKGTDSKLVSNTVTVSGRIFFKLQQEIR